MDAGDLALERPWSPTELGEQVFLRFREAEATLPDVRKTAPVEQH